jgi:hypothetical protein
MIDDAVRCEAMHSFGSLALFVLEKKTQVVESFLLSRVRVCCSECGRAPTNKFGPWYTIQTRPERFCVAAAMVYEALEFPVKLSNV